MLSLLFSSSPSFRRPQRYLDDPPRPLRRRIAVTAAVTAAAAAAAAAAGRAGGHQGRAQEGGFIVTLAITNQTCYQPRQTCYQPRLLLTKVIMYN